MAWFIAPTVPNLLIRLEDGRTFRFKAAEYRTADPDELRALRAEPRCTEVIDEKEKRLLLRPWVVNVTKGRMHDVARRTNRCNLSDELIAAAATMHGKGPSEGMAEWKLYRRKKDARRWHPGVRECKFCIDNYRGA